MSTHPTSWTCPSCGEQVPKFLPNGYENRVGAAALTTVLPFPEMLAAADALPGLRAHRVCLSCQEAINELLGALVRPPGELGDARHSPGLNDTGMIGAIVPLVRKHSRILIFHCVDNCVQCTEVETLSRFNPDRLTYPGSRGAIAPKIWAYYQEHLRELHQRYALSESMPDPSSPRPDTASGT